MPESQTFVPDAPQSDNAILTDPVVTGGTFDSPTVTTLAVLASKTIASGAAAVYDGIKFGASAVSITGATPIATAAGFNYCTIQAPTYSGDTVGLVIDKAATLYISGPPIAGNANTAISISYSLWVEGVTTCQGTRFHFNTGASTGGTIHTDGGALYFDYNLDTRFRGTGAATAMSLTYATLNVVVGATAAGATAAKCLALSNSATAPSASADLCHLYGADHGGTAASAALALYQEVATVTCGDQTVDRAVPITVNGVAVWVMARSAAPV